ncbi:MAG: DUF2235 domain-containing protein [Gammaproteobacteria bacterium]
MGKRIVICVDGTWNTPDQRDRGRLSSTNVAKMAEAIAPRDKKGMNQLVYYDKGVGTGRLDRLCGGVFGYGLSERLENAYRFLVEHFQEDDEIYLFGFSRGAYAVRSLAGFIYNSGLLRKEWISKFNDAHRLYRRRDDASKPSAVEARLFRKSFARAITIKLVGVWDTVGALGIPPLLKLDITLFDKRFTIDSNIANKRWQFHDVTVAKHIENAFHALAIDEVRKPYEPSVWKQQPDARAQRLEQAWFAGAHCNIGGGYNDTGLSDIAFLWMKDKAEECGLAFDYDYMRENVRPNAVGELRKARTGWFKLLPHCLRPIGSSNETVHESALERMAKVAGYAPDNLIAYLQDHKSRQSVGCAYQRAA